MIGANTSYQYGANHRVDFTDDRKWSGVRLGLWLLLHPTWRVLICGDSNSGTVWTDVFRVEIDHKLKVIRLKGDLT